MKLQKIILSVLACGIILCGCSANQKPTVDAVTSAQPVAPTEIIVETTEQPDSIETIEQIQETTESVIENDSELKHKPLIQYSYDSPYDSIFVGTADCYRIYEDETAEYLVMRDGEVLDSCLVTIENEYFQTLLNYIQQNPLDSINVEIETSVDIESDLYRYLSYVDEDNNPENSIGGLWAHGEVFDELSSLIIDAIPYSEVKLVNRRAMRLLEAIERGKLDQSIIDESEVLIQYIDSNGFCPEWMQGTEWIRRIYKDGRVEFFAVKEGKKYEGTKDTINEEELAKVVTLLEQYPLDKIVLSDEEPLIADAGHQYLSYADKDGETYYKVGGYAATGEGFDELELLIKSLVPYETQAIYDALKADFENEKTH